MALGMYSESDYARGSGKNCNHVYEAFWIMPLGLCNVLATFQCCMMALFSMVERYIEVLMNDFQSLEILLVIA